MDLFLQDDIRRAIYIAQLLPDPGPHPLSPLAPIVAAQRKADTDREAAEARLQQARFEERQAQRQRQLEGGGS